MMGSGAGRGGAGGDGDEHQTWLTEDEDVWGANADVPPAGGVLNTEHRYSEGY
jgi:hypothetical protein